MSIPSKPVRCAIYTRVSTDAGLDQEFNSLQAQYEAASAYIRSQAHAHWTQVRTRYDDGGFSGGSTNRPALQSLLEDVRASRVQVIVVYKVDRLTRSLADFAKLVELFDAHGVSFVSVTQQFNTTTSMGRLTLNVLLSFAQFEREVTSERIRDKVAASKRKGLWVGGMVPLGYRLEAGKLLIVEKEAEQVRTIFRRYLELGSVNRLVVDLREREFRSKVRKLSTGRTVGGVPFTQGPLFYILRNRFYVGEVRFKNEICPGPQPALLDRKLFDAVQEKLTQQWSHRTTARAKSPALLAGLLFDDAGHLMGPSYAKKNGVQYRYYVSQPHLRGQSKTPAGSVSRVPAGEVEDVVKAALGGARLNDGEGTPIDRACIRSHVARIEVRTNELAIFCKPAKVGSSDPEQLDDQHHAPRSENVLLVPWCKPPFRKAREILLPHSVERKAVRVIKPERRVGLIKAIARGRKWLDDIVSGASAIEVAERQRCSLRHVNMTLSLAFLAPALVRAAVEGRFPRGIGIERLRDLPAEWSQQFKRLGLPRAD